MYPHPMSSPLVDLSASTACTSKRITNRYTYPSSDCYPHYRKNGFYLCQADFRDSLADGNSETFIVKDGLDTCLSSEGLENGVIGPKQASNENALDTIFREAIVDDDYSASIRKEAIYVLPDTSFCESSGSEGICDDHFDASPLKVATDGHNFIQGEVANHVICESSSAVKILDDVYDAFTVKEAADISFCASRLSKDADVSATNAVTMKATGGHRFVQRTQIDCTSDDSFGASAMEGYDDYVDSAIKGSVEVRALKKGNGYVVSAVPISKSVSKVTTNEREVTHDAGFTVKANAEYDFYGDGSTQVIHDTGFMTKADEEQAFSGAHSLVGMPLMTGSAKNHQGEDVKATPDEEMLFISDTEKSDGQERCKHHSWQDLWHFQEENSVGLTASFISESDYADVINAVLDIAKSLPKNETLQDHLHPFSGRIDHLCGNTILYKLQKERLFVSAFSCFEWMRVHTPCLLTSRSLCTIFTISGEANMVNRALVLFNNLKHSKELWFVQVFNALLSALAKHCRYDEALSIFQEMSNMKIKPDNVTFCILMNLARRSGSGVKVLWQIFCNMKEQKVFAGHEVFAVLMKAFCKEGLRDEALKLLSVMEGQGLIPNIVIYNTLIGAFGKSGLLEEAEGLVSEMKAKGICMSVVTYNILIDAYGNTQNFEIAEALLQQMLDKGPKPNVCSYTALIAAYGRHFLSEKAASVFLRMRKNGVSPNAIAYTALIHAYAEDGWHEKAEYNFENMRREGLIPSVETYTSLLHAFRQAGDLRKVKSVWKMMRLERCNGTRATFNVLLDACAKKGDYAEARDVMYEFNKIGIKPDRKTYNMLINAFARGGQHSRAPVILEEMKNAGFSPDSFTYTTLIFSFLRVRDFTQAFKYHEKMCRDNQLPDKFTYRKLRALLDEKEDMKTERNMKAVIGAQRAQLSLAEDKKKVKSFDRRQRPLSSPRHRKSTRCKSVA